MNCYIILDSSFTANEEFESEDYSARNNALKCAVALNKATGKLFYIFNQKTNFIWIAHKREVRSLGIPPSPKGESCNG